MARKRSKRKKVEAEQTGSRGQVLAVFVLFCALVAIAVYLFDDRLHDPRYAVDLDRAINEATVGMPDAEAVRRSLLDCIEPLTENASILGHELTARIEEALERSPWVKKVKSVRRVFPGGIELDIDVREPFAEIEVQGKYLLIDKEGVVLPEVLDEPRGLVARLTLRPDGDPDAPVGSWDDAWLRDAIRNGVQVYMDIENLNRPELIDVLGEAGFAAVDISNHEGRRDRGRAELSLVSMQSRIEPGTGRALPFVIRWGRSSRHHLAPIELSTRSKLENLKAVLERRGRGFDGLRQVDLRYDDPLIREG